MNDQTQQQTMIQWRIVAPLLVCDSLALVRQLVFGQVMVLGVIKMNTTNLK